MQRPAACGIESIVPSLSVACEQRGFAPPIENPACDDGLDNDGDGLTDWNDPACSPTWPYSEKKACGLGAELALGALTPLFAARRRTHRAC